MQKLDLKNLFTSHSKYEHCEYQIEAYKRRDEWNEREKKCPMTATKNCTDERWEKKIEFLKKKKNISRKRERDRPNYTRNGWTTNWWHT